MAATANGKIAKALLPHKKGKTPQGLNAKPPSSPEHVRVSPTRQRIEALKAQLETTKIEMRSAVKAYKPKVPHRIDDLGTVAVTVLKSIPGVAEVTSNKIRKPTARIIHILDYHFVSQEDFARESER